MSGEVRDVRVEQPRPDAAVVVLEGEHDVATRDELASLLTSLVAQHRVVAVDVSNATFVDSPTIHVLMTAKLAAEREQHTLRVQMGTEAIVRRALEVMGVHDVIGCAETREEALA